jgi:GDP-4-dehydro-6-deoxy-D-mannose reductase
MATVLVTGASGHIGRWVAPILQHHGYRVFGLGRREADGNDYVGDLEDSDFVARVLVETQPRAIVHLAGGGPSHSAPYDYNIIPTLSLLRALVRVDRDIATILFGSAAEYGAADPLPLQESSMPCPVSAYGRAKLAQSSIAVAAWRLAGLHLTVVRPFNVVSCNLPATTALGNIRRQVLEQVGRVRRVECGRLDITRDYVDVRFVAECVASLIGSPCDDAYVNICSGLGLRLDSIVEAMARVLDVRIECGIAKSLGDLPAADAVVGSPTFFANRGLVYAPTAEVIAQLVVAPTDHDGFGRCG